MDFSSPQWGHTVKWLNTELDRLRLRNDTVGLSEHETAAIRGEIRAFKRLLALPNAAQRAVNPEPPEGA